MTRGTAFHHIGVACRDLDGEAAYFASLGYEPEGEPFTDPVQGVRGRFFVAPDQPRLELLVNAGETGPLDPWLGKGVKFYHFAYEARSLDAAITEMKAARARVLVNPVPAVAFGGRKIAFLIQPNGMLIELIEAPHG
jgi:catechol 2,3-dioxygenase-like lactoylglutathione lyase family enzyme